MEILLKSQISTLIKKGWIALDIDGTITDELHSVPYEVIKCLKNLAAEGWGLIFITGRPFSLSGHLFEEFEFPYFLAVQNGADVLQMPSKQHLKRYYINSCNIAHIENIYLEHEEDFVVYGGYEKGDICYWRPNRFSPSFLSYLEKFKSCSLSSWQSLNEFNFDAKSQFPLVHCFGSNEAMHRIHSKLEASAHFHATLIVDRVDKERNLILVTDKDATKGNALKEIVKNQRSLLPIIAAGDDLNDISMLEQADIKIAMSNAPKELLEKADIIAPCVTKHGIIAALKEAINKIY